MAKLHPNIVASDEPKKRRHFTPAEREAIYQTFLVLKNVSATARAHNVSRPAVDAVIKKFRAALPIEDQVAREKTVEQMLRERTLSMSGQILDSIAPEDLISGRLPLKNEKGEIIGYKEFGPSVVAKATAFGIMVDKIKVQTDLQRALDGDISTGNMLVPDNINQLVRAVQGQIKNLQILNVNFDKEHEDLTTRVNMALQVDEVPVEDVKLQPLDFDNP